MKTIKIIILTILPLYFVYAQNEVVDIKASYSCNIDNENTHQFDILIKANNTNSEIRAAEQNYRFVFDKSTLQNPRIQEEGSAFSGLVLDGADFSVYSPHTLLGSRDSVVSYNFELAGGLGTLLKENEWKKVGTLEFDVIDQTGTKEITWLGKDDFPPTVVIKKEGESLIEVNTNFYPTEVIGGNLGLANAFERTWQQPCLANEGWLKLDWSGIDDADDIFISIDGGANYNAVANSSGQFLVTNLAAGNYDIKVKLSEADCPVTLDDVNLFNFGFEATMESGYSCAESKGFITINWQPSPYTNTIKISINGGNTYTSLNDDLGTYTFNDLLSGNFDVKVLNSNGACLTDVGIAELVNDVEAPTINRGWKHTDCGESNGTITLSWANNPKVETIQISTDGGNTYEAIPDAQQFYFMDNLTVGDYDIWVKWGEGQDACAIQLDDVNLINAAPANTYLDIQYMCNDQQMRFQDLSLISPDFYVFSYRMQSNNSEWTSWIVLESTQDGLLEIPVYVGNASKIQYRFKVQCNGKQSIWSAPKTATLPKCKLSNTTNFFEVGVMPNPFNNRVQINISNNQNKVQKAKIELTNLTGKTIYTKMVDLKEGENSFNVELESSISAGIYLANILLDDGTKQTIKLLKK